MVFGENCVNLIHGDLSISFSAVPALQNWVDHMHENVVQVAASSGWSEKRKDLVLLSHIISIINK